MQVSFRATLINKHFVYKKQNNNFDTKLEADFVELDINSEEDYETIRSVGSTWEEGSSLAGDLWDMYTSQKFCTTNKEFPQYRYFALTDGSKTLNANNVLGIASLLKENDKTYKLQHLQVNPKHIYSNTKRELKHVGSAIIESILKLIPNKDITLYPYSKEAEKFYEKLNFEKLRNSFYMIHRG